MRFKDRTEAGKLLAAIPVLPAEMLPRIKKEADTDYAGTVGSYYGEFSQVTDEEVISLLGEV